MSLPPSSLDAVTAAAFELGRKMGARLRQLDHMRRHRARQRSAHLASNHSVPPAPSTTIQTWADSGASSILIAHKDAHHVPATRPHGGHRVQVATGDVVTSVASATVTPAPGLEMPVHIFPPHTLTQSLCGLAPFTRQGCSVTFTDTAVRVEKDGKVLLQGSKAPSDTLWPLPLSFASSVEQDASAFAAAPASTTPPDEHALLAITNQSNAEYVQFSHATFGSPPVSTFMRATTKGYLGNWPRLTARMIRQNTPNPIATHIGHLDRNRQGQRSTHRTPDHVASDAVRQQ